MSAHLRTALILLPVLSTAVHWQPRVRALSSRRDACQRSEGAMRRSTIGRSPWQDGPPFQTARTLASDQRRRAVDAGSFTGAASAPSTWQVTFVSLRRQT